VRVHEGVAPTDIKLGRLGIEVIERAIALIKNDTIIAATAAMASITIIIEEEGIEPFAATVVADIWGEASDTSFISLDSHYYFDLCNIRGRLVMVAGSVGIIAVKAGQPNIEVVDSSSLGRDLS